MSSSPARACLALTGLLLAGGCSPFEHRSYKDQGRICLFSELPRDNPALLPHTQQTYAADQRLTIQVVLPACYSSSCGTGHAQCTAKLQGTTLQVSSWGATNEGGLGPCTLDCHFVIARCLGPPLPAGTYQVKHGPSTLSLTVPSTMEPPCAGEGGWD
jgi:hypothetical protein